MQNNLVFTQSHTRATCHNSVPSPVGTQRRLRDILVTTAILFTAGAQAATMGNTGQCSVDALQQFAPANATLRSAQVVSAGTTPSRPPVPSEFPLLTSVPEYCLVEGLITTPLNDEGTRFRVALPTVWNDKFVYSSAAGMAGTLPLDTHAVAKGYASATSDAGHVAIPNPNSTSFARGQPGKLIDYAYRSNHLTVLAARSLIEGYYGNAPVRSIAQGCSGGGRASLIFAQRFPRLFDGYIVSAPAMDWSDLFLSHWVVTKAMFAEASNWIPPTKYEALGKAVLAACDRLDGAVDGVLQDPRACRFDPSVLRCAGDGPNCFTDDQLEALKAMTQVTRNKFGSVVARGWPFTGEERSWVRYSGVTPPPLDANGKPDATKSTGTSYGFGLARDFIFTEHPAGDYDWRTFDPDFDLGRLTEDAGLLSAMDPNLGPMASRGGKMLFVGGWSDQALPPQNWVDYVEAVWKRHGKRQSDEFLRLFMIPGMLHCSGGSVATDRFDALTEMEKWLDSRRAPDVIQAAHVDNNVVTRTRPLCAHPKQAMPIGGLGKKSVDDGAFWHCVTPAKRRGHGDGDDDRGRQRHWDDD